MVQALVLVGGRGTRLGTLTRDLPKPLVPIRGRPFLAHLLAYLRRSGVTDVVLCTGYRHQQIKEYCGDGADWGLRIVYSEEAEPLGTGGALCHAMPHMMADPVVLLNGDTYIDVSLPEVLSFHSAHGMPATLVALRLQNAADYGALDIDGSGRISGFREKQKASGPAVVNGGMYLLSRTFVGQVCDCPRRPLSFETDVLPSQAVAGNLRAFVTGGYFIDIGTPERYRTAIADLPEVGL